MSKHRSIWQWILAVGIALALVALLWTPYDTQSQAFAEMKLAGSSWAHWMGLDGLGRDLFSRVWLGTANSIWMGGVAMLGNLLLASALLWMEQKSPPWLSRLFLSFIAGWLAIPVVFIGLILLIFMNQSPGTLVLAAILGNVPFSFRQIRILWLHEKEALYIQASRVVGADAWRIFRRNAWPNLWPDLASLAKLIFSFAVLELSGLAFLGLIGDPDFPELGAMLRQNRSDLFLAPQTVIWPGLALVGLLGLVQLSRGKKDVAAA